MQDTDPRNRNKTSEQSKNSSKETKQDKIKEEDYDKDQSGLLTYEQAPDWIRSSMYLTTGYRPGHTGCCAVTGSVFSLHNETVNIWTHGLPIIIFVIYSYGVLAEVIEYYDSIKGKLHPII